jgi:hypothetical protein
MVDPRKVKAQTNRVQSGIVVSHHFDKIPVARAAFFGDHHTVMRVLLGPMPS